MARCWRAAATRTDERTATAGSPPSRMEEFSRERPARWGRSRHHARRNPGLAALARRARSVQQGWRSPMRRRCGHRVIPAVIRVHRTNHGPARRNEACGRRQRRRCRVGEFARLPVVVPGLGGRGDGAPGREVITAALGARSCGTRVDRRRLMDNWAAYLCRRAPIGGLGGVRWFGRVEGPRFARSASAANTVSHGCQPACAVPPRRPGYGPTPKSKIWLVPAPPVSPLTLPDRIGKKQNSPTARF